MSDADAIRNLVAANAAAANDAALDPAAETLARWVATFAANGVFELHGVRVTGREALGTFHARVMTRGAAVPAHVAGASEVAVAGDAATGRTDFLLVGDDGRASVGRYEDRFVRDESGWRIAHRRVVLRQEATEVARIAAGVAEP